MATATLEERVTTLEETLAKLTEEVTVTEPEMPWWKRLVGVYKDDPEFDEAERLGREYRESLRPIDGLVTARAGTSCRAVFNRADSQ